MNLTLLKGYPDFVGKRATFAGYGNGPSSYVTGGDPLVLPLYNYYTDAVFSPVYSVSGNYQVMPIPAAVGPRQAWKLKWMPATQTLPVPSVPLALGPLSVAATQSTYTAAGLLTVVGANSLVPGQFIVFSNGASSYGMLFTGVMAQVVTASPTTYTVNFGQGLASAYTINTDTLKYQVVQASPTNLLQGQQLAAPITGVLATTALLTITQANSLQVGQFVALGGGFKAASYYANGAIVQVTSATASGWTAKWQGTIINQTSGETGVSSLLVTNGNAPVVAYPYETGPYAPITNSLAVASTTTSAGLFTLTATQAYQPGMIISVQGLGANTTANGSIATVISTSLTQLLIKANGWTVIQNTQAETSGYASVLVTGAPAAMSEVPAGTNLSAEQVQIGGFCGQY